MSPTHYYRSYVIKLDARDRGPCIPKSSPDTIVCFPVEHHDIVLKDDEIPWPELREWFESNEPEYYEVYGLCHDWIDDDIDAPEDIYGVIFRFSRQNDLIAFKLAFGEDDCIDRCEKGAF